MHKRYAKGILVALAVLLNLGSGPLAFAHADLDSDAAESAEHCAGHGTDSTGGEPPAEDSELPCCASGHCACSAASFVFSASAPALVQFVRFLRADLRLGEPPSVHLNDPLRPPIA